MGRGIDGDWNRTNREDLIVELIFESEDHEPDDFLFYSEEEFWRSDRVGCLICERKKDVSGFGIFQLGCAEWVESEIWKILLHPCGAIYRYRYRYCFDIGKLQFSATIAFVTY